MSFSLTFGLAAIRNLDQKFLRILLRREARVENEVVRTPAAALEQGPEQDRVGLNEDPVPAPLVLEVEAVALLEAVPGSGLEEKPESLPEEELVDDVGLAELAVLALN